MNAPLMPPPGVVLKNNELSYRLEGLSNRETLVFKSMVRLLNHRMNYTWIYSSLSTELLVKAEGKSSSSSQPMFAQHLLTLGTSNLKRQSYLQIPLHADELAIELDRLGVLIVPTIQSLGAVEVKYSETVAMRMLRWPPATVLTSTTRVRMATLMVGKPLTIVELQQRSKESLTVCTEFFDDLRKHSLLAPATAAPAAAMASVQSMASTPTAPPMLASKSLVPPGLLGRIRMRLGLQTVGASEQAGKP